MSVRLGVATAAEQREHANRLSGWSPSEVACTPPGSVGAGEGPVTIVTKSGGRGVSTLLYRFVPNGRQPRPDRQTHETCSELIRCAASESCEP